MLLHLYQAQALDQLTGPKNHLSTLNRFKLGVLTTPTMTRECTSSLGSNPGATQLPLSPQRNGGLFGDSDSSCGIEFITGYNLEDDSDISSPPLWKTSPHTTPTTMASPLHHLRPKAMETFPSVPESTHELPLNDLGELPVPTSKNRRPTSEAIHEENVKKMRRRRDDQRRGSRNRSMDNRDFLLKVFLPAALGPKKRSFGGGTPRSKLLPKPLQMEGENMGLERSVDVEWWKKRFSSKREIVNNRTSSCSSCSSNSSTRRQMSGFLPSCWDFFYTSKTKTTGNTGCFI